MNIFRLELLNLQYTHLEGASVFCRKISDIGRKRIRKWRNNFLYDQLFASNE